MRKKIKINTWNALWSKSERDQSAALLASTSIHPYGRKESHRQKNRSKRAVSASK